MGIKTFPISRFLLLLFLGELSIINRSVFVGGERIFQPKTSQEFQSALDSARPGDQIRLLPMEYKGDFSIPSFNQSSFQVGAEFNAGGRKSHLNLNASSKFIIITGTTANEQGLVKIIGLNTTETDGEVDSNHTESNAQQEEQQEWINPLGDRTKTNEMNADSNLNPTPSSDSFRSNYTNLMNKEQRLKERNSTLNYLETVEFNNTTGLKSFPDEIKQKSTVENETANSDINQTIAEAVQPLEISNLLHSINLLLKTPVNSTLPTELVRKKKDDNPNHLKPEKPFTTYFKNSTGQNMLCLLPSNNFIQGVTICKEKLKYEKGVHRNKNKNTCKSSNRRLENKIQTIANESFDSNTSVQAATSVRSLNGTLKNITISSSQNVSNPALVNDTENSNNNTMNILQLHPSKIIAGLLQPTQSNSSKNNTTTTLSSSDPIRNTTTAEQMPIISDTKLSPVLELGHNQVPSNPEGNTTEKLETASNSTFNPAFIGLSNSSQEIQQSSNKNNDSIPFNVMNSNQELPKSSTSNDTTLNKTIVTAKKPTESTTITPIVPLNTNISISAAIPLKPSGVVKSTTISGVNTTIILQGERWILQNLTISSENIGIVVAGSNNKLQALVLKTEPSNSTNKGQKDAIIVQGNKNSLEGIDIAPTAGKVLLQGSKNTMKSLVLNDLEVIGHRNLLKALVITNRYPKQDKSSLDLHNPLHSTPGLNILGNHNHLESISLNGAGKLRPGILLQGYRNSLKSFTVTNTSLGLELDGNENKVMGITLKDCREGVLIKGSRNRLHQMVTSSMPDFVIKITKGANWNSLTEVSTNSSLTKANSTAISLLIEPGVEGGLIGQLQADGRINIGGHGLTFESLVATNGLNVFGCGNSFSDSVLKTVYLNQSCPILNMMDDDTIVSESRDEPTL